MNRDETSIERLKRGLYIVTHWPTFWTRLVYGSRRDADRVARRGAVSGATSSLRASRPWND